MAKPPSSRYVSPSSETRSIAPFSTGCYDACDKRAGRVSSLSLVRYRGTDYSVPTRFGHFEVLVRGYVHEVVISHGADVIARHPRSYEHEDFIFDPLHYLSLLEQKSNALDQAAPLNGWKLPPVFGDLRRLLEARMGKKGKREYVQVLRLLETFPTEEVRAGECPIFCVYVIWSMLPKRSKDDDDFQGTSGRVAEGLRAA